ncbi:MAG: universal stress protein [Caldithrix sp.]|nr:MAG: universal stress protein [Caldithrix sp.]
MIKSILLSVDGSSYTEAQVKYCIQLAEAFNCKIKVLSIVDIRIFEWAVVMGTDGFVPMVPSNIYKEESQKILETKADAVLDKCSRILKQEGIDFEVEKISGPPVDIICEKARVVDLLLMGARGEFAKWKSRIVGATLDAVVRQWNKQILITPEKFKRVSKVLFAYDGSDRANKALQLAGLFGTGLDVPVVILTIHDKKAIRKKYLDEAEIYLEPYKIPVELLGVSGHAEQEILNIADERQCDLIIMGAFGHSRIRETILGSTTEHVLKNKKIPVLLSK